MIESKLIRTYLSKRKYPYGKQVAFILFACCVVLSNFYWDSSYGISELLLAKPSLVFGQGEYWRLLTSLFIHGDMDHLLSNSLMLMFLVYFVTSFYGYFIAIVMSLLMGSLINYLVLLTHTTDTGIVGISGVIYYLWGFWLVLYLFIDKRIGFIRRLINIMGVFFILLIPTTYSPQTSYLAHYIGLLVGGAIGLLYYPLRMKKFNAAQFYEYRYVPRFEEDQLEEEEEEEDEISY